MAFVGFDARTIDTHDNSIMPGFHELLVMEITDEDIIKNFERVGAAVKIVLQPINKNLKIFDMICYEHTNPTVQEIAWKKLAQLCESTLGEKCVVNDLQIFAQKTCYAELRNEEYNGKTYLKVKKYISQKDFNQIRNNAEKVNKARPAPLAPTAEKKTPFVAQKYHTDDEDTPF